MQYAETEMWCDAIRLEIDSLKANGTWELRIRRPGQHILHSKWVFKNKKHTDGTLGRYRARLLACVKEKAYGVNYTFKFSAVMDVRAARVVLTLARVWKYQLDTAMSETIT